MQNKRYQQQHLAENSFQPSQRQFSRSDFSNQHRADNGRFDADYSSRYNTNQNDTSRMQADYDNSRSEFLRPNGSDSSYLGSESNSYTRQQSYGQGPYSSMNYPDHDISRKEGYGQYPQQNWKNTNEAQWQTSPPSYSSQASANTHFGKGPKGFKRSDERIREEVSEALYKDHAVDASDIEVSVSSGEITLSGSVTDRRMKRLAEDCIESIAGVCDIKNEIKIQSATDRSIGSDDATLADRSMDRMDKAKNRAGLSSNKVM